MLKLYIPKVSQHIPFESHDHSKRVMIYWSKGSKILALRFEEKAKDPGDTLEPFCEIESNKFISQIQLEKQEKACFL
jgi:hypothetical protein